jgi:L-aspartate oxidase
VIDAEHPATARASPRARLGLYAAGETSYTGLHGANRLASNSLLECIVLGRAAAQFIEQQPSRKEIALPAWDESRVTNADEEVVLSHNWDELRRFMWSYVGIVLELRNLVEVASLIVHSALSRRESRGLHFSRDFPDTLPTVLSPDWR